MMDVAATAAELARFLRRNREAPLAIAIGAATSLVVSAFIWTTELLGARLYTARSPAWMRLVFPTAGALVSGLLLHRFFPDARGSGIPLGREGPSVQIGAGIASEAGRRIGLRRQETSSLIPMGTAAALAAAFNTPIAGVLFTLEEVLGNMHARILGGVVLASASSWLVLHLLLGDEPLFRVPACQLGSRGG